MFDSHVYHSRRQKLFSKMPSGIVLLIGNVDSPINYSQNVYPFKQDGTFAYLFGLHQPGLGAIIDLDERTTTLFGDEPGPDDEIWHGKSVDFYELANASGCSKVCSYETIITTVHKAKANSRTIHILPPYRGATSLELCHLLGVSPAELSRYVSKDLIKTMVQLREVKEELEVAQIEDTLSVTDQMHRAAMAVSRPGVAERTVVAHMRHVMQQRGLAEAYAPIFTRHGEILHNHGHDNVLRRGDLVVNDYGASSPMGYATDVTRTLPIGGRFDPEQRDIYELLYEVQKSAIDALRPGVSFLDAHRVAALHMVEGMTQLGFFKGPAQDVVASGAYALCFPHGLGHQLGLDVHDMESFGEDEVGYDKHHARSDLFGLKYLRLAKVLRENMVVTVEPGIYFIPALIERWSTTKKYSSMINYPRFDRYVNFGGMRIEDDVLITSAGSRTLGSEIPKKIKDIEQLLSC